MRRCCHYIHTRAHSHTHTRRLTHSHIHTLAYSHARTLAYSPTQTLTHSPPPHHTHVSNHYSTHVPYTRTPFDRAQGRRFEEELERRHRSAPLRELVVAIMRLVITNHVVYQREWFGKSRLHAFTICSINRVVIWARKYSAPEMCMNQRYGLGQLGMYTVA